MTSFLGVRDRLFRHCAALLSALLGTGGRNPTFSFARILTLTTVFSSRAGALTLTAVSANTLDLCRRGLIGIDGSRCEHQANSRREHHPCHLNSIHSPVTFLISDALYFDVALYTTGTDATRHRLLPLVSHIRSSNRAGMCPSPLNDAPTRDHGRTAPFPLAPHAWPHFCF